MKKISRAIVTGGAGFIGSHIVDELISRGIETYVIDDLSTGSMYNLRLHKENKLLHVFIDDAKNIKRILYDVNDIDVIFHEAAIASVPKSITQPMLVHDVNVNMSLEVMNFCLQKKIKRFVFASTAAVYGVLGSHASESMVCKPYSPYGASKLSIENYLHAYYKSFGLETVCLRYFNVYGPRQILNDYSGVITIFINKLLSKQNPTIFGDGKQVRDFVHVKDIVRANMLAAESDTGIGEMFNVATGKATNIYQLFETIKENTKSDFAQPQYAPTRPGDVKFGLASIDKIKNQLGFEAKVSLVKGMADVVDYIRSKTASQIIHM